MRVGFPHSEILGSAPICRLPEAYRRLSRPSSPVIAKASTTCTYSLDPITLPPVARRAFAIRASLFSACAHHRPFELRQCTMQYITQCVLAHGRSRKQPDAPPTHHLHLSRIFKDQPILHFTKKPEEKRALSRLSSIFSCRSSRRPPGPGGANRDRTGDLLLAKQALSQLSYGPV